LYKKCLDKTQGVFYPTSGFVVNLKIAVRMSNGIDDQILLFTLLDLTSCWSYFESYFGKQNPCP
jgi:hypothetical protein